MTLTVERTYACWAAVAKREGDDLLAPASELAAQSVVAWCHRHFLRPTGPATVRVTDSSADFFVRDEFVVLAEVRALGLYVEPPRGWRARLRAFLAAP